MEMKENALFEGLNFVEVTEGMNGYPSHLKYAVEGFENFDDAYELSDKIKAEIVLLHKRDGWSLWESKGSLYEPIDVQSKYDSENYYTFDNTTTLEEYFLIFGVWELIEDMDDAEAIKALLNKAKENFEEIRDLEDGHFVAIDSYGDIIYSGKKLDTYYYNDTHHYTIALVNSDAF